MANEKRRARLLGQVTRLREIEHRTAAAAASAALNEAARSRQLADRAASLVEGYADFANVTDAHELAARRFAAGRMRTIAAQTSRAADNAATHAETRVAAERQARRKREAIDEARVRLELESAAQRNSGGFSEGGAGSGAGLARFLKDDPANQRGA